jgi:hypothetical protein
MYKNKYLIGGIIMLDSKEYIDINRKIDTLSKLIENNEREQSKFAARFGFENSDLYEAHDAMCDQMELLIKERHCIASQGGI